MRRTLIAAVLVAALCASTAPHGLAAGDLEETLQVLKANFKTYVKDLAELVAIPSISALPEHEDNIREAAKWLSNRLEKAGMQVTKVMETRGPRPVVYAEWKKETAKGEAKRKCVLIYGHYDVQPIDPVDDWETPPFKLITQYGGLYGRGADDDKGGLMMAVHATEALLNVTGSLPVDVKFLFEGEEEIMSPNLERFLMDNKALLKSDMVLSADGMQFSEHQGVIPIGMRGIVNFDLEISTAGDDVHSGRLGGSIANSAMMLAQALARLQDPVTGKILVPGFYDGIEEPDEMDKKEALTYRNAADVEKEQKEYGLSRGYWGEEGFSNEERRWFRPCCDVVGITGGYQGQGGIKTIIPHKARAKLSCRLVPGQDPIEIATMVMAYINADSKLHAITEVAMQQGAFRAWKSKRDTPGNRAAAIVLKDVFLYPPKFIREGGSIPALSIIDDVLKTPTTVFGFGLGNKIHAPNEFLPTRMYKVGLKAWAKILVEIANPSERWLPGDDGYPDAEKVQKLDPRGSVESTVSFGSGMLKAEAKKDEL